MTRIGLSALIAALAVAAPVAAAAGPEVTWTAPAGCPDEAHFAARIEAHLGDPVAADGVPVEVRIRSEGGRFSLLLRTEHGERALDGDRCADVVEAAALIVAMALEPGAGFETESRQPPTWARDGETPPPGRTAGVAIAERPRPRPEGAARISVRLSAGGDVGAMPGPTANLGLGAGLIVAPWRLEAGVHYLMSRTAYGAEMDEGHQIGLYYGSLAVCHGSWLRLCAGGELGRFQAEAFGYPTVETPRASALWWGGLIASVVYARDLGGPLLFRIDGQISLPISRPRIGPGNTDTPDPTDLLRLNHQPAHADGRVMAGLELVFP